MTDPAAAVAARLAELWLRSLPTMHERLAALRSGGERLRHDPGDLEARASARDAAHKLSGVLGIFGLPRGTEIAAEMEALLKSPEPLTPQSVIRLSAQVSELEAVIASKGQG